MELEYFIYPDTWQEQLAYWKQERLSWYHSLCNRKSSFRLRQHERDELAHYAQDCFDIEYAFPWGWDELEGIASRGDYDLRCHERGSGSKLSYFDQQQGKRFLPYVIEPSAGLTRSLLAFLLDAYEEGGGVDTHGKEKKRVFLKLSPQLAPYKAVICPLLRKGEQASMAEKIALELRKQRVHICYDDNQSIGKRYAKHDEIGTPYALTVDEQSLSDQTVTLRDRDTTEQKRLSCEEAIAKILSLVQSKGSA